MPYSRFDITVPNFSYLRQRCPTRNNLLEKTRPYTRYSKVFRALIEIKHLLCQVHQAADVDYKYKFIFSPSCFSNCSLMLHLNGLFMHTPKDCVLLAVPERAFIRIVSFFRSPSLTGSVCCAVQNISKQNLSSKTESFQGFFD